MRKQMTTQTGMTMTTRFSCERICVRCGGSGATGFTEERDPLCSGCYNEHWKQLWRHSWWQDPEVCNRYNPWWLGPAIMALGMMMMLL